jgi:hypothetical protein
LCSECAGLFTFFTGKYTVLKKKAVTAATLILAGILIIYWGLIFLGFGGYIFIPPDRQSYGSVDDGGSIVTLLALSKDIHDGKVNLGDSNVTIILTSGEEVTLQGADRYVQKRFVKGANTLPASLVNLEMAGQNGPMVYFKRTGLSFTITPMQIGQPFGQGLERGIRHLPWSSMISSPMTPSVSWRPAFLRSPSATPVYRGWAKRPSTLPEIVSSG